MRYTGFVGVGELYLVLLLWTPESGALQYKAPTQLLESSELEYSE